MLTLWQILTTMRYLLHWEQTAGFNRVPKHSLSTYLLDAEQALGTAEDRLSAFCGAYFLVELAKILYMTHQYSQFIHHFLCIMSLHNVSSSLKWIHSQCWQKFEPEKLKLRPCQLPGKSHPERSVCLCWQHPTLWGSDLQIHSKQKIFSRENLHNIKRDQTETRYHGIKVIKQLRLYFLSQIFFYLAYKPQFRAEWSHSRTEIKTQNGLWPLHL